jgi:hypothetical protein
MTVSSHVDYLTIVGRECDDSFQSGIIRWLLRELKDAMEYEYRSSSGKYADFRLGKSAFGLMVKQSNYNREEQKCNATIVLSGEVIARLGQQVIHELLSLVARSEQMHVTRIDLATDDYGKVMTPREVLYYAQQGCFVGLHAGNCFVGWGAKQDADTFVAGSRNSSRLVRVYNKSLQSKGTIDAIRWETELHGKYCPSIVKALTKSKSYDEAEWSKLCGMLNAGYFELREANGKEHKKDRPFVIPFAQLMEDIGGIVAVVKVSVVRSLERTAVWFDKNCTKAVLMLCKGIGKPAFVDYLWKAVEEAEQRVRRADRIRLDDWREYSKGILPKVFDRFAPSECPI